MKMKKIKLSLFILGFSITSYGQRLHLQMKDKTDKYFALSSIRNFTVSENAMNINFKDGKTLNQALNTIQYFNYDLNTLSIEPQSNIASKDVMIYPNPTSDEIKITISENSEKPNLVYLYQATGELVLRKEIQASKEGIFSEKISLNELNPGVYYLGIQYQNTYTTNKIIKN
jgi:hypothetical protein